MKAGCDYDTSLGYLTHYVMARVCRFHNQLLCRYKEHLSAATAFWRRSTAGEYCALPAAATAQPAQEYAENAKIAWMNSVATPARSERPPQSWSAMGVFSCTRGIFFSKTAT